MAQYHTRFYDSDGTIVEVKKPSDSTWTFIPGVTDFTSSGGEPTSNEVTDLHGVSRAFGRPTPEAVSMTIPAVQIGHPSYDMLREALVDGDILEFRWRQPNEVPQIGQTAATNTLAIATDGSVTKAGTAHPDLNATPGVGPGSALKIDGDETAGVQNYRVIATVPASGDPGAVTLAKNPSAAVSAGVYAVVLAPFYQPAFSARVSSFTTTGTAAGSITGSLSLGLTSLLPALVIGTTT